MKKQTHLFVKDVQKKFCLEHLKEHKQFPNEQFDLIENDYN